MNNTPDGDRGDHGEIYLNDDDIIHEIDVDEEDLPDADDDVGPEDGEDFEEVDDSMHIFTGHDDEVYAVVCCPTDAMLVATSGKDDMGFLWKIGDGNWASQLEGHTDTVTSLAFSTDGNLLASGSFDGLVKIWDASGNLRFTFDGPGGIEWVRWHPRGHVVLAGSEDKTTWMWNADQGGYLNMFSGHADSVTCGDFTPDGKSICTGSKDATLRIWNPRTGEATHVVKGHPYHTEGLTCLALNNDSTLALTGSTDHNVHIVNISTGQVVSSLTDHTDSVECIGLAASAPLAATGSLDGKLIIWDLQHSIARCIFDHEEGVTCLSWLGTSSYVATGCVDGKVRIWDGRRGLCLRTFRGHSDAIQSLGVSANGDFLVSVSLDQTARVFEINEFN